MDVHVPSVVVTRDFHVYGPGDVRIDYRDGQTVSVASVPAGQNVQRWIDDELARFSVWAILGVLLSAIAHRVRVTFRRLRCW